MENGSGAKTERHVTKKSACKVMNKGGTTGFPRPFVQGFFYWKEGFL